jgi:hypothetical protein
MNATSTLLLPILCVLALGLSQRAQANNVIVNGDFESTFANAGGPYPTAVEGQFANTNLTAWTATGYGFVFTPSGVDSTGSTNEWGSQLTLWGPNSGSNNGMTASPTGGNFLGMDGDFNQASVSQLVSGLTIGNKYEVSFYWAAAQQAGFDGDTTEHVDVTLGAETYSTSTFNLPNHGFSGWMYETITFTASNTSDILTFLAQGTPVGQPPFVLLDGVTMDVAAVPEPSAFMLGAVALGAFSLRRNRKKTPTKR